MERGKVRGFRLSEGKSRPVVCLLGCINMGSKGDEEKGIPYRQGELINEYGIH